MKRIIGIIDDACQLFDKIPKRNAMWLTTIIAGYAQKGQVDEALRNFQQMPERNVASWNAMIARYAQSKHGYDAMKQWIC